MKGCQNWVHHPNLHRNVGEIYPGIIIQRESLLERTPSQTNRGQKAESSDPCKTRRKRGRPLARGHAASPAAPDVIIVVGRGVGLGKAGGTATVVRVPISVVALLSGIKDPIAAVERADARLAGAGVPVFHKTGLGAAVSIGGAAVIALLARVYDSIATKGRFRSARLDEARGGTPVAVDDSAVIALFTRIQVAVTARGDAGAPRSRTGKARF